MRSGQSPLVFDPNAREVHRMSYGGKVTYSFVKVKVLKASKPGFWYASDTQGKCLIGYVVEVRKRVITTDNGDSVTYEYLKYKDADRPAATYYIDNNDLVEVDE